MFTIIKILLIILSVLLAVCTIAFLVRALTRYPSFHEIRKQLSSLDRQSEPLIKEYSEISETKENGESFSQDRLSMVIQEINNKNADKIKPRTALAGKRETLVQAAEFCLASAASFTFLFSFFI